MTFDTVAISDKQIATDLVERMLDSATLEQIREGLSIAKAIRDGIADADAGRIHTHEEVVRRSATWIAW